MTWREAMAWARSNAFITGKRWAVRSRMDHGMRVYGVYHASGSVKR